MVLITPNNLNFKDLVSDLLYYYGMGGGGEGGGDKFPINNLSFYNLAGARL